MPPASPPCQPPVQPPWSPPALPPLPQSPPPIPSLSPPNPPPLHQQLWDLLDPFVHDGILLFAGIGLAASANYVRRCLRCNRGPVEHLKDQNGRVSRCHLGASKVAQFRTRRRGLKSYSQERTSLRLTKHSDPAPRRTRGGGGGGARAGAGPEGSKSLLLRLGTNLTTRNHASGAPGTGGIVSIEGDGEGNSKAERLLAEWYCPTAYWWLYTAVVRLRFQPYNSERSCARPLVACARHGTTSSAPPPATRPPAPEHLPA
eukprot:4265602-Prymnesium_polylepis.2